MDINNIVELIKKYGLGIVVFAYILIQHYFLIADRDNIIHQYQEALNSTTSILIRIDEKLRGIGELEKEVTELRYEQRRLNDMIGLPSKRYTKE